MSIETLRLQVFRFASWSEFRVNKQAMIDRRDGLTAALKGVFKY